MRHAREARPGRAQPGFQVQVRVEGVAAAADSSYLLSAGQHFSNLQQRRFPHIRVEQVERLPVRVPGGPGDSSGQVRAALRCGVGAGVGRLVDTSAGRSPIRVSTITALPYGKRSAITTTTFPGRTASTCLPGMAMRCVPYSSAKSTPWCGSSEPGCGGAKGLTIISWSWLNGISASGEHTSIVGVGGGRGCSSFQLQKELVLSG